MSAQRAITQAEASPRALQDALQGALQRALQGALQEASKDASNKPAVLATDAAPGEASACLGTVSSGAGAASSGNGTGGAGRPGVSAAELGTAGTSPGELTGGVDPESAHPAREPSIATTTRTRPVRMRPMLTG